jgi:hypothetical protein
MSANSAEEPSLKPGVENRPDLRVIEEILLQAIRHWTAAKMGLL